jgi:hypothetical protein
MTLERKPTETFEQYQARRKAENLTERTYLRGMISHQSKKVIVLTTQQMVDEAKKNDPLNNYVLGQSIIVHSTYKTPPNTVPRLDKWQRRKLRKIVEKG